MTDSNEIFGLIPPSAKTILDVGAGSGYAGLMIKQDSPMAGKVIVDGIEGWKPLYDILPPAYDRKYFGDVEEVLQGIADSNFHYDVVLCSHVLEHLDEDKMLRVLHLMESIATMRVIVASPNAFHTNDIRDWGSNPLLQHRSVITSHMAKRFGYSVRGSGRIFSIGVGLFKRLTHRLFPDWIGYKDMGPKKGNHNP